MIQSFIAGRGTKNSLHSYLLLLTISKWTMEGSRNTHIPTERTHSDTRRTHKYATTQSKAPVLNQNHNLLAVRWQIIANHRKSVPNKTIILLITDQLLFSCLPTFSRKCYFDHCKWNASNTDKLRWGRQIARERLCGKFHQWGLLSEAGEKNHDWVWKQPSFLNFTCKGGRMFSERNMQTKSPHTTETTPNILCTMHNYSPTQFNNYKLCMFSEF